MNTKILALAGNYRSHLEGAPRRIESVPHLFVPPVQVRLARKKVVQVVLTAARVERPTGDRKYGLVERARMQPGCYQPTRKEQACPRQERVAGVKRCCDQPKTHHRPEWSVQIESAYRT